MVYSWLSSHYGSGSRGSWQSLPLEQLLGVSFSLGRSESQGLGNQKPDFVSGPVLVTGNLNTQTRHRKIRGKLIKVECRESTFGSCSQERAGEGYSISLSFQVALPSPNKMTADVL